MSPATEYTLADGSCCCGGDCDVCCAASTPAEVTLCVPGNLRPDGRRGAVVLSRDYYTPYGIRYVATLKAATSSPPSPPEAPVGTVVDSVRYYYRLNCDCGSWSLQVSRQYFLDGVPANTSYAFYGCVPDMTCDPFTVAYDPDGIFTGPPCPEDSSSGSSESSGSPSGSGSGESSESSEEYSCWLCQDYDSHGAPIGYPYTGCNIEDPSGPWGGGITRVCTLQSGPYPDVATCSVACPPYDPFSGSSES